MLRIRMKLWMYFIKHYLAINKGFYQTMINMTKGLKEMLEAIIILIKTLGVLK
jgi:hypothetical protein